MDRNRPRWCPPAKLMMVVGLAGLASSGLSACSSDASENNVGTAGASGSAGSSQVAGGTGGAGGTDASATAQTQAIVDATNAFLATLTSEQAAGVQFKFDRPAASSAANYSGRLGEQYGKAEWSNYPVSDVPRPGLTRGSLTAAQVTAETTLLQTVLSSAGYQKVLDIMGADEALSEAGTNFESGTATYTIAILGTPSTSAPWMIAFGGHHLGLNIVIDGDRGTVAPTLTGAQPAVYSSNGKTVRALAAENDKAFALLAALDDTQRAQAILGYTVSDLVLGPGKEGATLVPEGVKASALTEAQRTMLLDVINEWVGILQPAYVTARMADIKKNLDETYFAWSGATTHATDKNGASYYRIQGPTLVIEFSPQGVGGDPTNHVHTVYRDPTNDYGHTW